MIAFCRSLGIPARLNAGFSIKIEKEYPYWGGDLTFSSGSNGVGELNGHACYEVYYSSLSTWIPGDPAQQTANFTHVSNVWLGRAPDLSYIKSTLNISGTISSSESQPTGVGVSAKKPKINYPPTLTSVFEYVYHDQFFGSLKIQKYFVEYK
jgi:transglutaminase-like putative cysteine protease